MSVSTPFFHGPIVTSLLGFAGVLGGILLPVFALPQVDFPTIQVTTQLPGGNPADCSAGDRTAETPVRSDRDLHRARRLVREFIHPLAYVVRLRRLGHRIDRHRLAGGGIVKKNAILMIGFAIDAERYQGFSTEESIVQTALLPFRPIMMTTLPARSRS